MNLRSERRKYIHFFENVQMVVYVFDLLSYDYRLDNDYTAFREDLMLFEEIANSRWFSYSSITVFLANRREFGKKLQDVPLQNTFNDYTGNCGIELVSKKTQALIRQMLYSSSKKQSSPEYLIPIRQFTATPWKLTKLTN
jgi:hypothetical protein